MAHKIKAHVVTHTHWDREWYLSFEVFRVRLLTLMDSLSKELEEADAFKFFTLDGQTVILEDYFELRPEKKEEILSLIRRGKIDIGPWYVLPDEFLITGESFIRNFLIAKGILQKFDIKGMNIGYLPDMFGHNAYTPSILKGLGFKAAILWRGVGDASRETEFLWSAPNGDTIFTVNLLHSYSNGAHFGMDIDKLKEVFKNEIKTLSEVATTDNVLIMNGTDHEFPIYSLPEYFYKWSEEFGDVDIIHSTFSQYVDSVERKALSLKRVKGELKSPKYEHILKDITSTRIYIKLLNFHAQKLYIKYVEPLSAFLKVLGDTPDVRRIEYGWKLILKSHPHDSICGCSIDKVHKDVEVRLRNAIDVGLSLVAEFLHEISKYIKIDGEKGKPILVFNPYEYERDGYISTFLPMEEGSLYEIVDENGKSYPIYEDSRSEGDLSYLDENTLAMLTPLYLFKDAISPKIVLFPNFKRVLFRAPSLPGFGFKVFYLREVERCEDKTSFSSSLDFENEFYKFSLNKDGTFNLLDKINNIWYSHLNYFEDVGDRGDEYNFSQLSEDIPITTLGREAKVLKVMDYDFLKLIDLKVIMHLPSSLTQDRDHRSKEMVEVEIGITYKLYRDLSRIDVILTVDNKAKDHRLSFVVNVPEKLDTVINDGYFGLVSHPSDVRHYEDDYAEEDISRYAMESFAFVNGKKAKFAVSTQGIYEYESHIIDGDTKLAFTLLRAVGWLSRGDLLTRKGEAGPFIETPEAQCIGKYKYNYSFIILERGDSEEVYKKTRDFLYEPISIVPSVMGKKSYMLPKFVFNKGVFLSAFKISNEGDILMRVYNQSIKSENVKVSFPYKMEVYESNMREDLIKLKAKNSDVFLRIEPYKIESMIFRKD